MVYRVIKDVDEMFNVSVVTLDNSVYYSYDKQELFDCILVAVNEGNLYSVAHSLRKNGQSVQLAFPVGTFYLEVNRTNVVRAHSSDKEFPNDIRYLVVPTEVFLEYNDKNY